MSEFRISLADAMRSACTSESELRAIEAEALEAGRADIASTARAELARRAEGTSRKPR